MLSVGQSAEITRRFSAQDLSDLTALTGRDPDGCVPEPLIASLFSYLLGVQLPGPGTNYLKQDLHFHQSAPLDWALTARVEITRLRPDKHLVDLQARCTGPSGELVCDGRSLVLAKDVSG